MKMKAKYEIVEGDEGEISKIKKHLTLFKQKMSKTYVCVYSIFSIE
jgi:hypothetical protein